MRYRFDVSVTGLLLISLVLLGTTAHAQQGGAVNLAEIENGRVTISPPSLDALPCGLEVPPLLSALSDKLQAGGITPVDEGPITITLSVLTHLEPDSDRCGTATMLGVYKKISYFDEEAGWLRSGQIVLWQRGTMILSPTADHREAVIGEAERLGGALLETWRADQSSTSG
jgi:hypothetical protein